MAMESRNLLACVFFAIIMIQGICSNVYKNKLLLVQKWKVFWKYWLW